MGTSYHSPLQFKPDSFAEEPVPTQSRSSPGLRPREEGSPCLAAAPLKLRSSRTGWSLNVQVIHPNTASNDLNTIAAAIGGTHVKEKRGYREFITRDNEDAVINDCQKNKPVREVRAGIFHSVVEGSHPRLGQSGKRAASQSRKRGVRPPKVTIGATPLRYEDSGRAIAGRVSLRRPGTSLVRVRMHRRQVPPRPSPVCITIMVRGQSPILSAVKNVQSLL